MSYDLRLVKALDEALRAEFEETRSLLFRRGVGELGIDPEYLMRRRR